MIDYYEPKIDLTLLGCGFLGFYHIGAVSVLQQIWPKKPYSRIAGASCGGLIGVLLMVGLQLEDVLDGALNIISQLHLSFSGRTKKFISLSSLVYDTLDSLLPENAHQICTDRVGLSVTRTSPTDNEFVSSYKSRRELIEAVVAGCFIPFWSGSTSLPVFRDRKCFDGAYSDNKPKFDSTDHTRQIEICPFASDTEVCPPDKYGIAKLSIFKTGYWINWNNVLRTYKAMLPFPGCCYKKSIKSGHEDMKRMILDNNLIKCRTCCESMVSIHHLSNNLNSACISCLSLLERVESLKLPQRLLNLMDR